MARAWQRRRSPHAHVGECRCALGSAIRSPMASRDRAVTSSSMGDRDLAEPVHVVRRAGIPPIVANGRVRADVPRAHGARFFESAPLGRVDRAQSERERAAFIASAPTSVSKWPVISATRA
jgi:hypothetical protein